MAEKKPTVLNKWSGMGTNINGDSGVFYAEGFYPRIENGQMMMSEVFKSEELINVDTTGLEDYDGATTILYLGTLNESESYKIMMENGEMFSHQDVTDDEIATGKIHTIPASGSLAFSNYPDLQITESGNILYSSSSHIGVGYRGIVKDGSSTTTIIDDAGRNFDTLFPALAVGHNKVTNLKTGQVYTITSITTTNSTNDTLNFTSVGVNTNLEGEEFIAWYDDKFDLFDTTAYPQFSGQASIQSIRRQIQQYDSYYFLNGNFLGNLGSDETTFDDNYKQLPSRHQGLCFDINGDKIIVCSEKDGQGYLLLWDTYSDNWNNILKVDKAIYAIKSYGSGWTYHSGGSLYWTDGFSVTKLSDLPDKLEISEDSDSSQVFDSLFVDGDNVYLALQTTNYNRLFNGIYYFTLGYGWTFIPFIYERKYFKPYCVYKNNVNTGSDSFKDYIEVGGENSYNRITIDSYDNEYFNNNFIYELNLNAPTQVKTLRLGVISDLRNKFDNTEKYCDLYVSVWGGKYGYSQYIDGSLPNPDQLKVVKATYPNIDIGNQVFEISSASGQPRGERMFLTELASEDATYKTYTLSPSTTRNAAGVIDFVVIPTKFTFHKVIKLSELDNDVLIPVDKHFSDKLFIQVMTRGIANSFPLSVLNINIE